MSDTKHFRGPDKHVTMHECLENRGELIDQEIVHSIRPTQVTAKKERKNVLYLSVSVSQKAGPLLSKGSYHCLSLFKPRKHLF